MLEEEVRAFAQTRRRSTVVMLAGMGAHATPRIANTYKYPQLPVTEAVRVCAELDCLLSLASIANGLHWVCPQVTAERVIIIKGTPVRPCGMDSTRGLRVRKTHSLPHS